MNNNFSEEMLAGLREKVKYEMGEKRYNHTLEVEKMAVRLGCTAPTAWTTLFPSPLTDRTK